MKNVIVTASLVLVLGFALYAMNKSLSIPDVVVSASTNECVKVMNYNATNYTCDNLPETYNQIWGK